MYFYRGNIHIHSEESDGAKSIREVAKIASEENLRFYHNNDHDVHNFTESGYYGWCLVISGVELAWNNQHMLVISKDDNLRDKNLSPHEVIDLVNGEKIKKNIFHKGIYRVEIWKKRLWIFTNNIYVY